MKQLPFSVRTLLFFLLAVSALGGMSLPTQASAQTIVELGLRGGYEVEQSSAIAGAEVRVNSLSLPFIFNPSVDYYISSESADDVDLQADLDALIPFGPANQVFTPYAGGGFSLQYVADDPEDDNTDFGFNGVGGAVFNIQGTLRPYVQARVTFTKNTYTNVTGGILFIFNR